MLSRRAPSKLGRSATTTAIQARSNRGHAFNLMANHVPQPSLQRIFSESTNFSPTSAACLNLLQGNTPLQCTYELQEQSYGACVDHTIKELSRAGLLILDIRIDSHRNPLPNQRADHASCPKEAKKAILFGQLPSTTASRRDDPPLLCSGTIACLSD